MPEIVRGRISPAYRSSSMLSGWHLFWSAVLYRVIAFAGSILDIIAGLTSVRMAQGSKSFEAILSAQTRKLQLLSNIPKIPSSGTWRRVLRGNCLEGHYTDAKKSSPLLPEPELPLYPLANSSRSVTIWDGPSFRFVAAYRNAADQLRAGQRDAPFPTGASRPCCPS